MIVLDTNVASELTRPGPDLAVLEWLSAQEPSDVFLSAVSEAELRYGLAIMPEGRRRNELTAAVEECIEDEFAGRLLPFDSFAAEAYATIAAARRAAGRPIAPFDCQIAAIARSRGASVATRDSGGFEGTGVDIIDPWVD
ncbi:MAG: type II toxin-antitoxin system VapC family toxin [Chloroflexi bacterium]|nr:type II toxin-antitoxin system VapC family toxin [Chloroflexota bacterium]